MSEQSKTESGEQPKRKTIKELIAEHAAELAPSNGDKAYTIYHGKEYVGVLENIKEIRSDGTIVGEIVPEDPNEDWGWHGYDEGKKMKPGTRRGLDFGYDEPIKYDVERGMWYAPADYD